MKYKLIICLLIFNLHNISAGNTKTKGIANSMFVTISGSSTINQFQLTSNKVIINQQNFIHNNDHYYIEIPVFDFHSKNKKITSDFRELIKAENHPIISIAINPGEIKTHKHKDKTNYITGTITLAGQSHQAQIKYLSTPTINNKIEIKGEAKLNLSYFNLEPPEKLFGAIKVHDRIFVNFVVYVESLKKPAH
ncbi:MAG: hypothetical protein PF486_07120 [Prolixibacteraceae bacterium]|nr:hypothetical protein [Prolixibacteraceae bacterium]